MNKRPAASVILLFSLLIGLHGFEIKVAQLFVYDPDTLQENQEYHHISFDLINGIRALDSEGVLNISGTDIETVPKSLLEAAEICQTEDIVFLIYGYLKATEYYLDFELKLYDRDAGAIQQIFYAKTSAGEYAELVETMTERVLKYFYDTLGITEKISPEKEKINIFTITAETGYWFPFNPWSEILMGLVSVGTNFIFQPIDPLLEFGIYNFSIGYGLSLDYYFGRNRDGYESSFLHAFRFGTPFNVSLKWHNRNMLAACIAPEIALDILSQDRIYSDLVTKSSSVFAIAFAFGYERIVFKNMHTIGVQLKTDIAFYDDALVIMKPSVYMRFLIREEEN